MFDLSMDKHQVMHSYNAETSGKKYGCQLWTESALGYVLLTVT